MTSPRPTEPDVHLSVFLHGLRFDYIACISAAATFIQEWREKYFDGAVTVVPDQPTGLRRLPNERLYLDR